MSKKRCSWVNEKNPLYVDYHDREWGRPVHDDVVHFEMITLEGAQAGLSWETILNKRDHYRKVFYHFEPNKVSKISSREVDILLQDSGIVRNRRKVESAVSNAKAFLKIQVEFGSFDSYMWSFVDSKISYYKFEKLCEIPTQTPTSERISKDLKKRGFRFVGSTIIYAYMQAIGMVQNHALGCFLYGKKL